MRHRLLMDRSTSSIDAAFALCQWFLRYGCAVAVGAGAVVAFGLHGHCAQRTDRAASSDDANDLGAEYARLAPRQQAAEPRVLGARLQVEALQDEDVGFFLVGEADLAHGELDV